MAKRKLPPTPLEIVTLPRVRVYQPERLTHPFHLKFGEGEFGLIRGAAATKKMSIAEFIRLASVGAAKQVIEDMENERRRR